MLSPRYKSEARAEALPEVFAPELEEFKYQVRLRGAPEVKPGALRGAIASQALLLTPCVPAAPP